MKRFLIAVTLGAAALPAVQASTYDGRLSEFILNDYKDTSLVDGDPGELKYQKFTKHTAEINAQKIDAAKKAIDSGRCDSAYLSLFDLDESTEDNFVFDVYCENGSELKISSKDIRTEAVVKTNAERAVSKKYALAECKKLIKAELEPGLDASFSDLTGSSYNVSEASGNVSQLLDFQLKNALGRIFKYRASCIFTIDGKGEVHIQDR